MAKFKQEVLDKIKEDVDLFGLVAKAMNIQPASLGPTIARNGASLNQFSVVKAVADYLKKDPEDLLEPDTVKEAQS